MQTQDNTLIC